MEDICTSTPDSLGKNIHNQGEDRARARTVGRLISNMVSMIKDDRYGNRPGGRRTLWKKRLTSVAVVRSKQEARFGNKYIQWVHNSKI